MKDTSPFHLNAGENIQASFSLAVVPAYNISGNVSNFQIYRPLDFELIDANGDKLKIPAKVNMQTGDFVLPHIASGAYTLRVTQDGGNMKTRDEVRVAVAAVDVRGVNLALSAGPAITGSVQEVERNENNASGAVIELTGMNPNDRDSYVMSTGDDGSMPLINVFPGTYNIRVFCFSGYAVSLLAGEEDLLNTHKLKVDRSPLALDLTCSNKTGTVSGSVQLATSGSPLEVLFLDSSGRQDPAVSPVRPDGAFEVVLAPGIYRARVLAEADQIEYRNPDVASRLQSGEQVEVSAGATVNLTLKGPGR